jgi:hypothetical protein
MTVNEIRNLSKKENHLHYRNEYAGALVFTSGSVRHEAALEFTLERDAMGKVDISVSFPQSIHYPLVPAIRKVKDYIMDLDKRGKLS